MGEVITDKTKLKKNRQYNEFIDEDTKQILYVDKHDIIYSVYILYKNGLPIYVGKSTDIKKRMSQHKSIKRDFDSYSVPFTSYMENVANIMEQTLISYIKSIHPLLENKSSVRPCGEIIKL